MNHMPIMEMLYMHHVYVEPGRAKDTCSSELPCIWCSTVTGVTDGSEWLLHNCAGK
jgi:hypothetical protein